MDYIAFMPLSFSRMMKRAFISFLSLVSSKSMLTMLTRRGYFGYGRAITKGTARRHSIELPIDTSDASIYLSAYLFTQLLPLPTYHWRLSKHATATPSISCFFTRQGWHVTQLTSRPAALAAMSFPVPFTRAALSALLAAPDAPRAAR